MPGPINSQCRRSLGRPSANRGYQSIGTDTLRPSRSSTMSACSVTLTCLAAAISVARLEVVMPCLQQLGLVCPYQHSNLVQFVRSKSKVVLQPHWLQTRTWRSFDPAPRARAAVRPDRSKRRRIARSSGPGSKPVGCGEAAQPVEVEWVGVGRVGRRRLENLVDVFSQYHAYGVQRIVAR
jgi:hypothetical protein